MSAAESVNGFSARELRDAFGLFPTGVAIITAQALNGERLGLTVSSFNSVSIDPPLVLFSVAKNAKSIAGWENIKQFAVNILGENQSELSTRFAKALTDKWQGLDPLQAKVIDAPLIRDALASLECELWTKYDGGDHIILIGKVLHLSRVSQDNPRPLLFATGRYRRLDSGTPIETPFDVSHLLHGW